MPVSLELIREELLPGLYAIAQTYRWNLGQSYLLTKEVHAANVMAPVAAVPLKEAILFVAAAKLASNPTVSRRFWEF